jgi:hypothetical protein
MTESTQHPRRDPHSLDYAIDIEHPSLHASGDIGFGNAQPNGDYGKMTFYRNRSPNGLRPELCPEREGGPSLKLAVARDAYLDAMTAISSVATAANYATPNWSLAPPSGTRSKFAPTRSFR